MALNLDRTTRNVLGFLVSKGLLFVDEVEPNATAKLDLQQVLKVGTEIEPRVLEVLPAALLHFPRTFTNWEALPDKVKEVVAQMKSNAATGPDLAGIPYASMKRWADRQLPDKRTTPISERRVMKSLRFKPQTLMLLKERSEAAGVSETEFLERLVNEVG